jgi:hypothetical protein
MAAGLELQACRDVESKKVDQVNEVYDQLFGIIVLVDCQLRSS